MKRAIFNWSGGKDSALALYYILQQPDFEAVVLLTSVNKKYQRISMHGVRKELLLKQAGLLNIPLSILELPEDTVSPEEYDRIMYSKMCRFKQEGYTHSVFGDIFLEDLRAYREERLAKTGIKAVFPLWKRPTRDVIHEFIDLGFKTVVVSANAQLLDRSFVGRVVDHSFLEDLPEGVDPCGENGEFHTFVFDGPLLSSPVGYELGEIVHRSYKNDNKEGDWATGFWYCDLKLV